MLARGTTWPGAIGGKARDPSGKPSRVVLGIRVTEAEREVWQRAADAHGLPVTEWVRRRCHRGPRRHAGGRRDLGRALVPGHADRALELAAG